MLSRELRWLPGADAWARLPILKSPPDRGGLRISGLEVREGLLGKGVYTLRPRWKGKVVLRGWGERVPHRTQHSIQVDLDTHILPDAPLRLLNHSCEPNCGLWVRRGVAELQVHALRHIAAGEELTLDYATFEEEIRFMPGPCLCHAPACRQWITGFHSLPNARRSAYGPYIAEYLREAAHDLELRVPTTAAPILNVGTLAP